MRITRTQLYVDMIKLVAKRSQCTRRHVGAILVKDNRIIAMGYNGVLPGADPATGIDEKGNSHTVHAEINIIAFCAKNGIPTENTEMWLTLSPCEKCAETIIQAGIRAVYFLEHYRDDKGIKLLNKYIHVSHLVKYAK